MNVYVVVTMYIAVMVVCLYINHAYTMTIAYFTVIVFGSYVLLAKKYKGKLERHGLIAILIMHTVSGLLVYLNRLG